MIATVAWQDERVGLIDQRRLPDEEVYLRCADSHEVAVAIRDMAIRGAPAIGVAAALGLALGVRRTAAEGDALRAEWDALCAELRDEYGHAPIGSVPGVYLIRATTPTSSQTIRVVRQ